MAGMGEVAFFSISLPADPRLVLAELCKLANVAEFKYWSTYIDNSWEALQFDLGQSAEDVEPYIDRQFVSHPITVTDAISQVRDERCSSFCSYTSMFDSLINAGVERVPESLRNGFLPGNFSVRIGPHYLFEAAGEVIYFGKAMVSVSFDSAHTPNDWEGTRRAIYESPEIQEIARMLEPVMGKVEVCAFWDI